MTTATQTAAVQEPETSIHEPMETVSEHQRTLSHIKEAQRAERKEAKMKEKAIALAEQQAYDEEARLLSRKREVERHEAFIRMVTEREQRAQTVYSEFKADISATMSGSGLELVTDTKEVSIYTWEITVPQVELLSQTKEQQEDLLRRARNDRHNRFCKISNGLGDHNSWMKFHVVESDDNTIVGLTAVIDNVLLMQQARATELSRRLKMKIRELYENDPAAHDSHAAIALQQLGIVKVSADGNVTISLNAGDLRRGYELDFDLQKFSITVRTNDGGLTVSPEGHGTVSITRERSPYTV